MVMNPNVFQMFDTEVEVMFFMPRKKITMNLLITYKSFTYQNLDALVMAVVTLLKHGKHPPGNIYSFMNSELSRYAS